jgi:selenide,water dikinase
MLADLNLGDRQNLGTAGGRIALDCSVRRTRQGHYAISTTDFFFPLVDSPYLQGWIGACNVLSDLYAQGCDDTDFVLMLLASCREMPEQERNVCTKEMVRGFHDACLAADCPVTGGQTVLNPWPIVGGVATSIVSAGEYVPSDGALPGDALVLTKPLGTQIAVNVHQWRRERGNRLWKKCAEETEVTEERAEDMMHEACVSMARLNRSGAALMLKYGARAGTDVTGFGIRGHAQNLAENQKEAVGMVIDTLPCLKGSMEVNCKVFDFGLRAGTSAETSGGLLISLPADKASAYCQELGRLDGSPAWIVGRVVADPERKAVIVENVTVLEV